MHIEVYFSPRQSVLRMEIISPSRVGVASGVESWVNARQSVHSMRGRLWSSVEHIIAVRVIRSRIA
jgi:hypothetical protein